MSAFIILIKVHELIDHFNTDVLQKRPTTPTLKHHTVDYLRTQTKSFDYTLAVMSTLERQVCLSSVPTRFPLSVTSRSGRRLHVLVGIPSLRRY